MTPRPLEGVRVADFTWIGAGSFTTKLFADMGADVIKIESAARLDQLREARPFKDGVAGVNRSGYFADRNSSKRSVTLNLKKDAARELARELVKLSDIVANNFTPGTMEKFGLGYADVAKFKPDVIYLAMSMNGNSGPEASYLGFGLTMGALTGLQNLCGAADRQPVGTGTNFPDHVPNPTHAAFATMAALRHRRRTGEGQLIDLAQIEPTVALLGPTVLDFTANGRIAARSGNEREGASPHGVYPCRGRDRWIAIAVVGEDEWRAFSSVVTLQEDARFSTIEGRLMSRTALDEAVARATEKWDALELMHRLQAVNVAAGVVADAADVLIQDPQLAHRGHWAWLEHREMGRTVYGALPFRMSKSATSPTRPAPLLGEHTEEVCRDILGLTDSKIAALRSEGALL